MSKDLIKKVKKIHIYKYRLVILIENKAGYINKFFKKQGINIDASLDIYAATTLTDSHIKIKGKKMDAVYLLFSLNNEITHGLIAHEARHATNAILHYIGQKLDPTNDECEAYLSGWVNDQIYKVFRKNGLMEFIKHNNF